MIRYVLTVYRTFLQIALLRKGPESIPHSQVLLFLVTAVWLAVEFVGTFAVNAKPLRSILIDLILVAVSLLIYAFVVAMFRRRDRILRLLVAVLGTSALFGIMMFTCLLLMPYVLVSDGINWIIVAIALWSVTLEAHIMAKVIEQPWSVGFLVAFAVFVLQLQLSWALNPVINSAT